MNKIDFYLDEALKETIDIVFDIMNYLEQHKKKTLHSIKPSVKLYIQSKKPNWRNYVTKCLKREVKRKLKIKKNLRPLNTDFFEAITGGYFYEKRLYLK